MSRRRGMTLIEVMLALVLFSMLSLFVFSIVNSVLGLWQTGERRGSGDLSFAAAVERLRSDLGALHTGPRGWMIVDDYEARASEGDQPPWRLPRLRFLAHGGSLPADDPSGRKAVEVAWLLVPADALGDTRLTRLVRIARVEDGNSVFDDERNFMASVRGQGGTPMLDGVLWASFNFELPDGGTAQDYRVPAESPLNFPRSLELSIERVGPNAQQRPLTLDDDLGVSGTSITVRGNPPLLAPSFVLIGQEWVAVNGTFPRLTVVEHGVRSTNPSDHPRGSTILSPESYQATCNVASGGRRIWL
jgi:prepilin-type N-terminal cleavage/methylation domain-containing protein